MPSRPCWSVPEPSAPSWLDAETSRVVLKPRPHWRLDAEQALRSLDAELSDKTSARAQDDAAVEMAFEELDTKIREMGSSSGSSMTPSAPSRPPGMPAFFPPEAVAHIDSGAAGRAWTTEAVDLEKNTKGVNHSPTNDSSSGPPVAPSAPSGSSVGGSWCRVPWGSQSSLASSIVGGSVVAEADPSSTHGNFVDWPVLNSSPPASSFTGLGVVLVPISQPISWAGTSTAALSAPSLEEESSDDEVDALTSPLPLADWG